MTPFAAILVRALAGISDPDLTKLARRAGVSRENMKRAARGSRGRSARVNDHVRICAVTGTHPVTGAVVTPWKPCDPQASALAIALRLTRCQRQHNIREAADVIGISIATISRLENQNPRSLESVLAACRYIGVDPMLYVNVTHETTTRNTLTQKADLSRRAA